MPPRQQTIAEFLSSQPVIRVYFDSMPYGTGNQAASYQLMGRLRELGFKNKYTVVYIGTGFNVYYPDGNLSGNIFITKEKIINLFNLPHDLPEQYYDEKNNIEFIDASIYYKMKKEHHTLAITGGQLEFCVDTIANGLRLMSAQATRSLSCNDANIHEVDLYLMNEAWVGKNPSPGRANVKISVYDQMEKRPLNEADHLFNNPSKSPSLNEIVAFLKDDQQSKISDKKRAALLAFIDGVSNNKFHVMPFYGGPIKSSFDYRVGVENYAIFKMLHYIMGVKMAKVNGPRTLRDKPIVLAVFDDYILETKSLKKLLADAGEYSDEMSTTVEELELNNPESLRMVDISSKNFNQILETLQSNQILLVSMGKLPTNVFNTLYAHTATLPPVLEGENTKNLLIAETNKPFLRSLPWFFSPYSYGPEKYYPNEQLLKRYQEYDETNFFDALIPNAKWVMQFIIDSFDPESDICQYFNWLHQEAIKPENDRVVYALNKAITILTENKKIPLVAYVSGEPGLTNELISETTLDIAESEVIPHDNVPLSSSNEVYNENSPAGQLVTTPPSSIKEELNRAIEELNKAMNAVNFFKEKLNKAADSVANTANKALDSVVDKMVHYAEDVVRECPSYFGKLDVPQYGVNNLPMFFNVNNTCVPCLPTIAPKMVLPQK